MLKRIICIISVLIFLVSTVVSGVDTYGGFNTPVDIDINGSIIKCVHKPILINGSTYIPLRAFSDAIGCSLEWNENEMSATITKDDHLIEFYTEKECCVIDGKEMNYSSVLYNNLTFIPVRVISEVLGYNVSWDEQYLTVKISAPGVVVADIFKDETYSYEDILYLGKIIQIESGYQPFEVKLAVGATVVNRVKSTKFPNTVKDVIFDTKYGTQFPPVHTDKINVIPSADTVVAAKCVLNGVNNAGNSLYFIETRSAKSSWAHRNRPHFADIGAMSFYE